MSAALDRYAQSRGSPGRNGAVATEIDVKWKTENVRRNRNEGKPSSLSPANYARRLMGINEPGLRRRSTEN